MFKKVFFVLLLYIFFRLKNELQEKKRQENFYVFGIGLFDWILVFV